MGAKSEEEKDYWYRPNALPQACLKEIQEWLPVRIVAYFLILFAYTILKQREHTCSEEDGCKGRIN